MAVKRSLLEQMAQNPASDWKIKDVETLCRQVGLKIEAPTSGSHYKVTSKYLAGLLTVPHKRPIKVCYVKELVRLAEAHIAERESREKEG
jgi:hypothetical protein